MGWRLALGTPFFSGEECIAWTRETNKRATSCPEEWSHTALFAVPYLAPPGGFDFGIGAGVAYGFTKERHALGRTCNILCYRTDFLVARIPNVIRHGYL